MNAFATSMMGRARAVATVWRNPVVIRDLRVRMRGSRSYWHLAAYLSLLGLLALAGYATATESGGGMDPVEVQTRLQAFYYFIFFTLAGLVCLIAPALTAASITTERQRQTLDLLVTTPMSSAELLTGKLVSSVAFLALLLAMSLPASTLCVILGGATLGDVLRTYLLLALDGLVLSAVGLYMSCTQKNSMQALMSTYGAIIGGLAITAPLVPIMAYSTAMGHGSAPNPVMAVAALHPAVAVMAPSAAVSIGGVTVPAWPITVVAAFLAIRLLLTGATYRMGSYGTDALGSLRRQLLLITGLGAFLAVWGFAVGGSGGPFGLVTLLLSGGGGRAVVPSSVTLAVLESFLLGAFYFSALFLPSLFVPVLPEGAAPGAAVEGTYDIRKAFRAEHAGALPYFHLWVATLGAGGLLALFVSGAANPAALLRLGLTLLYILVMGFALWSLCRRAAAFVPGMAPARGVALAAMVAVALVPLMVMVYMVANTGQSPLDLAFAPLWLGYPVTQAATTNAVSSLWTSILIGAAAGILLYPVYKRAVPATPRAPKALPVFGAAEAAE